MGIRETLIKLSESPSEALISITGNREICVENCRSITACDENLTVLRLKGTDLRIVGSGLVLDNYGAYGVRITGAIHSLTFEDNTEV